MSVMVIAAQDSCHGAAAQFRASGLPPGNSAAVPLPEGLQSPGRQVGLTRLVLTDFRKYRSARLDLDAEPVVLTGPPCVTGFAGGRPAVEEIVAYWPALIDRREIEPAVRVEILEA